MIRVYIAGRLPDGRFVAVGEHDLKLLHCRFLLILHVKCALAQHRVYSVDRLPDSRFVAVDEHAFDLLHLLV